MPVTPRDDTLSTEEGLSTEEIEGAPPAETREEMIARHLRETVTINRYLYHKTMRITRLLLAARNIAELLDVLLVRIPRLTGFTAVELWLYDPDDQIRLLDPEVVRQHQPCLTLQRDRFALEDLYAGKVDLLILDAVDPRMFSIFNAEGDIEGAVLVPLLDGEQLVGSLHYDTANTRLEPGEVERYQLRYFADVVTLCIRNTVRYQALRQQTVIDPLTRFANRRGFERLLAQEIARAQRANDALSVLCIRVDELEDIGGDSGTGRAGDLLRKVAERLASALRAVDQIARIDGSVLAVVLPGVHEIGTGEVAERLRHDIERYAVDDGHGAVLQVTLSIGGVCWEPLRFPAVHLDRLARQLESAADRALANAQNSGGNRVAIGRLTTLMV